ncbi:glycoside hydrolase family 31 protein [Sinomonas albida]|uniref:glycoside hydrolase family 31 protein n=1 Tax=Sinomonas albida TaxID=369942 RepID=UPI003018A24E
MTGTTRATRLPEHLRLETSPQAQPTAIVQGPHYRFTVLTSQLIRLEYSETGEFEDRASQVVLHRDLEVPEFRVVDEPHRLEIVTQHVHLVYDKREFTPHGLSIKVLGKVSNYHSVWHYGEVGEKNLGGTARTLDGVDGPCELEPGLMSRYGFATLDDSETLVFDDAGWLTPRGDGATPGTDLYFFGYGRDYRACLRDFYRISGPTPLVPRFTLGNWWSRYYRYTEEEYRGVVERFDAERTPLSVAVLDMDWHLTEIDPVHGSGWTGYTWNRELFPDPEGFARWLHGRGLALTLNVHPADGIAAHEEAYERTARALGLDPEAGDAIAFDPTDPEFLGSYLREVHHPLEEAGVDFWWLDWQSGPYSRVRGLDPLWVLNHVHFLDSARNDRLPLTFSRYAGPGSHRYPIGFSGDTIVTWESLAFQPYFTATASNIGYGWWSHDIGGHMWGYKDDDLAARWVQLGVFSPINRLHSSSMPFTGKEPWRYRADAEAAMGEFLRLRHRLVPYLHTMNHRASAEGRPIVEPMYYEHPETEDAYEVPNQFLFGTELMVAPVVEPRDRALNRASAPAWLPPGLWIDFFTGTVYRGGRRARLYRTLETMPVLARAGAIVPMAHPDTLGNGTPAPERFELRVFAGASGEFTLIEDDGGASAGEREHQVRTPIHFDWDGGSLSVRSAVGMADGVPTVRSWEVVIAGVREPSSVRATSGSQELGPFVVHDEATNTLRVIVDDVDAREGFTLTAEGGFELARNRTVAAVERLLDDVHAEIALKGKIFSCVTSGQSPAAVAAGLSGLDIDPALLGAVVELVLADAE